MGGRKQRNPSSFEATLSPLSREFRDPARESEYLADTWPGYGPRVRAAALFSGVVLLLGLALVAAGLNTAGDMPSFIATRIAMGASLVLLFALSYAPRPTIWVTRAVVLAILLAVVAWLLPKVVAPIGSAAQGPAPLVSAMLLLFLLPIRFTYAVLAVAVLLAGIAADLILVQHTGAEVEFALVFVAATLLAMRAILNAKQTARFRFYARRQLDTTLAELRRTEAELKRNADQLQTLLEAMDQAVAMVDQDRRFVAWNSNFERMFELPPGFMHAGKPFAEVLQRLIDAGYFGQREVDDRLRESVREPVAGDRFELPLPGGRYIDIRRSGLPDGGIVTTYTDITERKKAENLTRLLGMQDPLTRLANRALFLENLVAAIVDADRFRLQVALLMIDLDHFKPVNDTYGHPVGDAVLQKVATILTGAVRDLDTVARLGGDEFAVVLTNLSWADQAALPARRILAALQEPMDIDGRTIRIGGSIGIAFFPEHGRSPDELIARADAALYAAKGAGRNCIRRASDVPVAFPNQST